MREEREREVQKKTERERERERESGVIEQTLHVAVEGVIWLWRGTNSQVRQTVSPDELPNGEQSVA